MSYIADVPSLEKALGNLDGTNALLLRELDRMAELENIASEVETLVKETLITVNRHVPGGESRPGAAVNAIVSNMNDSLSRMTLNSVEALSVIGLTVLHPLLRDTHSLHGHAHALPFGAIMQTLAASLAAGTIPSRDSPIPEQTQHGLIIVNQLVVTQKTLSLVEQNLVHSIHAMAHLLRAQVTTVFPPASMVHHLLAINRTVKELMLNNPQATPQCRIPS